MAAQQHHSSTCEEIMHAVAGAILQPLCLSAALNCKECINRLNPTMSKINFCSNKRLLRCSSKRLSCVYYSNLIFCVNRFLQE